MREKLALSLVALMVLLQGFYALYSFIDPQSFSVLRGTELVDAGDTDWVRIYASRTLFVSLIVGVLLYKRQFNLLFWASIAGLVMPTTDALLAYGAGADFSVVAKHIATSVYLLVVAGLLHGLPHAAPGPQSIE